MEHTGMTRGWRMVMLGGLLGTALGGCSACQPGNPDTESGGDDAGGSQIGGDGGGQTQGDGGVSSSSGATSMAGSSGQASSHGSSSAGTSGQASSGNGSSQGSSASNASGASSVASSSTGTVSSSVDSSSVDVSSGATSSTSTAATSSGGVSASGPTSSASNPGSSASNPGSSASNPASSTGGASSTTMASSTGANSSSGGGCPALILGTTTEDVYVDKAVAMTGTGTLACPFKTILEASSLTAPGNAVSVRTIHVRGHAGSPTAWDYPETAPIVLASKVTLTSAYDASDLGSVSRVRITAAGNCAAVAGAGINCAVAMNHGSTLEKVTVSVATGGTTQAIATATGTAAAGTNPATIRDVDVVGATGNGIRVSGSVTVGPRVNVTQNAQTGLNATMPPVSIGSGRPVVSIVDGPSAGLASSNSFNNNTGNGAVFFGDMVIDIGGGNFSTNAANGLVIGTPLSANVANQPTHQLRNIHAENNGFNGFRLVSGDVKVVAGSVPNTFNGNGTANQATQGYGIQSTLGDSLGGARLELEASNSLTGTFLVAHQANNNKVGGVLLNQSCPAGFGPHLINSLQALSNGGLNALGDGVFVQVTGANQPSAKLRGNTLNGNTGAGLRYQQSASNTLDIGTFTGVIADPGFNIFADNGLRNSKTAVCLENLGNNPVTQEAERDRWATGPCPFGGGPLPATFIAPVISCYRNLNYVDITYVSVPAVSFTASTCF